MNTSMLNELLALAPPPQAGKEQQPFWVNMIPMVLLVAVFYFALIRPQQRKAKQHTELLKGIKPGDRVVTSSGIVGQVITVKEKTLTIRSSDSKFEITKAAVADITERNGESSES